MGARRADMHRLQELVRLHRMGCGARETASRLRMSPNTEREYRLVLQRAGLLEVDVSVLPELSELRAAIEAARPPKRGSQEESSAAKWRESIEAMMANGAKPKAIFDTLSRETEGFDASLWAVRRLYRRLRVDGGVRPEDVAIRVTTIPGAEAQVDFGYVGRLYDPERGVERKAWVFVMALSYSRHQFARVVFDQSSATWLRLHVEAFEAFGGVPAVIRPDNLKAAVVRAAFGADDVPGLNRSYRELARHYGFKIEPTPPFQPQKRGKVERDIRYVKSNFFLPLKDSLADIHDANTRLNEWVAKTAGLREHGTTGWKPLEQFAAVEQAALLPLPAQRFRPILWKQAKVHSDSHVVFERRLYPVPWRFIGKTVWLRVTDRSIEVSVDDQRVITHERGADVPDSVLDRCLPAHRADYRHRGRSFWEQRADAIAVEVGAYIRDVFDSDEVLSLLRQVQSLVTMLESHPVERAIAACRRAAFYGCYDYRSVRDILRKGLDFEPLPTAVSPAHGHIDTPQFARTTAELLRISLESYDEPH